MKGLAFILMFVCLLGVASALDWSNSILLNYNFDETSGVNVESFDGLINGTLVDVDGTGIDWDVNGLINGGVYSNRGQVTMPDDVLTAGDLSWSIWVNFTSTNTAFFYDARDDISEFILQYNTDKIAIYHAVAGGHLLSDTTIDKGVWNHIVYTYDHSETNLTAYLNGVAIYDWSLTLVGIGDNANANGIFVDGATTSFADEFSIFNRTLSKSDIGDLYNSGSGLAYGEGPPVAGSFAIDFNSPGDNTQSASPSLFFNVSITPTSANITNTTLFIWDSDNIIFNKTTNIITGEAFNETTWNITNFSLGQSYHWNTLACGTNSTEDIICSWAVSNYSFISSAFSSIFQLYNISVFETQLQRFSINISSNPLISSASATLWYDKNPYTSIVTDGTAGIYKANNLLDIPLSISQSANKTFYWQWNMQLTTGEIIKQNTSLFSHTVNKTYFEKCVTNNSVQYVNFTVHSSMNPFPVLNATFKFRSDHWLGSGTVKRNYSFEEITGGNHTFNFCFSKSNDTINTDATIEFDSTGYSQNYHYLIDAELTNTTNEIDLYLLNDSLATLTVLKIRDQAQNPLGNIYIQTQLYDVGTDTYYTVGMSKTSFNGEDIIYLNWYDSFYRFILTSNGSVIRSTAPYKISSTPQIFEISTETTFTYDKFDDFLYNLYYNPLTENFVLTFIKPSGLVDSGCLRVLKRNPSNDINICTVCETSSSATIYCNIAGYGNGTYIASFYATGSLKIIDTISEFIGAVDEIYTLIGNTDGSVYAFIFAGVVVSMFFFSPVMAIIGLLLGMGGAIALGFQPVNYLEFLGIVILGGTVIWLLER